MPHIELSFLIPAVIVAALVLAAIAVSAFFYRHTLPPVSRGKRLFLTILRGAALSLLLILPGCGPC
jgi:hypothetical protein